MSVDNIIYAGAGNDFVMIDGRRSGDVPSSSRVKLLCAESGTDGLIVLKDSPKADFEMLYFNSDGSSGMMCGNGGRCIVAFAADLGISPSSDGRYLFEAPDSMHEATIVEDGPVKTVRLKMRDVHELGIYEDGIFLDTGTRHFVVFTDNVDAVDIEDAGPRLRHDARFAPIGVNVNFVQICNDGPTLLKVRTFEKGVEAETLACGTGIVAMCMAAYKRGVRPSSVEGDVCVYRVEARGGNLSVEFRAQNDGFSMVYLTGPAGRV